MGASHAVAVSSGTAALHLALILAGVSDGDEVLVSTLTFSASVNPIVYERALPVFIDSETTSWNLDPNLVEDTLRRKAAAGTRVAALVPVHLYGQSADMDAIMEIAQRYGVPVVEDAAEALGATCYGQGAGHVRRSRASSRSTATRSSPRPAAGCSCHRRRRPRAARAASSPRRRATPAPHYQHSEVGYNYRMSNVLAGIGRGQLQVLEDRVQARRANFAFYQERPGDLPGVELHARGAVGPPHALAHVPHLRPGGLRRRRARTCVLRSTP